MSWVKIDDRAFCHPKLAPLPGAAAKLWLFALCWSSLNGTDGDIPRPTLRQLGAKPRTAQALVDAGLWHETDAGWTIHDYHDYNPSSAQQEARKQAKVAAGRAGGKKSGAVRAEKKSPKTASKNEAAASHVVEAKRSPDPDPTRPDPTPNNPPTPQGKIPCPADLSLTEDQAKSLEASNLMIPRWAIVALTDDLVVRWIGNEDPSKHKTLSHWRSYLLAAIRKCWQDPKRRPRKPDPTKDPAEVARARRAREEADEAEDERYRQELLAKHGGGPQITNLADVLKDVG